MADPSEPWVGKLSGSLFGQPMAILGAYKRARLREGLARHRG